MTTYDESKHERDDAGKFTTKDADSPGQLDLYGEEAQALVAGADEARQAEVRARNRGLAAKTVELARAVLEDHPQATGLTFANNYVQDPDAWDLEAVHGPDGQDYEHDPALDDAAWDATVGYTGDQLTALPASPFEDVTVSRSQERRMRLHFDRIPGMIAEQRADTSDLPTNPESGSAEQPHVIEV